MKRQKVVKRGEERAEGARDEMGQLLQHISDIDYSLPRVRMGKSVVAACSMPLQVQETRLL